MAAEQILAIGKLHDRDVTATAVNPGDWFGKVWLLWLDDCFDPPMYAVEADTLADAEDILAEWEHCPPGLKIDIEVEGGDYGFEDDGVWTNLKGEQVTDPAATKYLGTPQISGQGVYYDTDNLQAHGDESLECPWPCRYTMPTNPRWPAAGVAPADYSEFDSQESNAEEQPA